MKDDFTMTNREKYIDNASNEELAQAITNFVMRVVYSGKRDKNKNINECIAEWLSQEAEEDIVNISNIGKMPETDKTKTADKMFEELGYKRITGNAEPATIYEYKKEDRNNILIHVSKHYYYKCDRYSIAMSISEAEDKAIHKKIEELKNEKRI